MLRLGSCPHPMLWPVLPVEDGARRSTQREALKCSLAANSKAARRASITSRPVRPPIVGGGRPSSSCSPSAAPLPSRRSQPLPPSTTPAPPRAATSSPARVGARSFLPSEHRHASDRNLSAPPPFAKGPSWRLSAAYLRPAIADVRRLLALRGNLSSGPLAARLRD